VDIKCTVATQIASFFFRVVLDISGGGGGGGGGNSFNKALITALINIQNDISK
jgi:hypothetical protein